MHQFNVFTVNTPMQYALAAYLAEPAPYLNLAAFYADKRDFFRLGLAATKFELLPCEGSYFQCVNYSKVAQLQNLTEGEACTWLTRELGVAAIPLEAFYPDSFNQQTIRFCFAKRTETLQQALLRLQSLS